MKGLFPAAQVRAAEQAHSGELDDGTLMQRASYGLAHWVVEVLRERFGGVVGRNVLILVGAGNNGGDALFAGARLAERGARVRAVMVADRHHVGGGLALHRAGGSMLQVDASVPIPRPVTDDIAQADVIIDGILGLGALAAPREPARTVVDLANASSAVRIAVDLPTGVDPDSGAVAGTAFKAHLTVTFGAIKAGLFIAPGKGSAGRVEVVDIGIDDALGSPIAEVLEPGDVAQWLPMPTMDDHKYRRGVVGVVAGSPQYRGAGLLCVTAALAGPTGMTVLLDRGDGVADLVVAQHPEVVCTDRLPSGLGEMAGMGGRVTGWTCGPGLQTEPADLRMVAAILSSEVPVVLDAGALGLLAASAALRDALRIRRAPTVLTPHEGESARLADACGLGLAVDDRLASARGLADALGCVVLLKGPGSIIATPDGTCFVDEAGTPALATAGSGDVLAGLIGSLLACAQAAGRVPSAVAAAQAAAAGCWLHGMAGRRAAGAGFATASQIAAELHAVTDRVSRSRTGADSWDDVDVMSQGHHAR